MLLLLKMKYHILILFIISSVLTIQAQSIAFSFNDGSQLFYELDEVGKFTFSSDTMNLHLTNGAIYSWHLDSMNHYEYEDEGLITSVSDPSHSAIQSMKLYPNPSLGQVTVEYTLNENMLVTLEIANMQVVMWRY
jgi:hypothetical protein